MMDITEAAHHLHWTESHMPLMKDIAREFEKTQPFRGIRIGVSLHLEVKTAVLLLALRRGGADVVAAGNYGTSQDDIVALLRESGIDARGSGSDTRDEHLAAVQSVVESKPDLLLDNGADLLKLAIDLDIPVLGATEETTSGHMRLTSELAPLVQVPVIVINDSPLKAIVENKHAVGQWTSVSPCKRARSNGLCRHTTACHREHSPFPMTSIVTSLAGLYKPYRPLWARTMDYV